jgi:hypothetical protein
MPEPISEPALRTWRMLSWVCVLSLCGLGIYWNVWLPPAGKGGLLLAVGAVLMPLFWEKAEVVGKMSWIAMVFILLAVEYRAIDKDRQVADQAQKDSLTLIGNGFTDVLKDQRTKFADLLKKSDDSFRKTTEQASRQFDATMSKSQENLNELTGGNSYLYFTVMEPIDLTDLKPSGNKDTDQFAGLVVTNLFMAFVGRFPLHDVHIAKFCQGWQPGIDYGTVYPTLKELGKLQPFPVLAFRPLKDRQHCFLNINTSNGSYQQDLFFLKQNDHWMYASRFSKYGRKKPIKVTTSPGFPNQWRAEDWN